MNEKKSHAIAVFSSANTEVDSKNQKLAAAIGKYLAEKKMKVVSGGSLGIPAIVIQSAKQAGATTEGFFPDYDPVSHTKRMDNLDLKYFDIYHFSPGFTERSLSMLKNIDGALVLNGRIGTLSEFCMAVEEGIPIAIIRETGGISDELDRIVKIAQKEFPEKVIFEKDYKKAIDTLVSYLDSK